MILDRLVDKLSMYWSWLYYRQWEIWELKIGVITISAILLVLLLWLIVWRRRRKTRARIAHANQGVEGPSVIGVNKDKRMMIKKIAIVAIIIVGLIDLGIFCYRRPKPTKGFYFRSHKTGKLIGPVSLPKGHLMPPLDEQTYIVIEPAESELEVRKRLLRPHVKVSLTDIPLTEALDHILTAYFGHEAPPVRIVLADESKMSRISIDVRNNAPLYEVLFNIASQANVYISIENGTIVMSQKEFKVGQVLKNTSKIKTDDNDEIPIPQAALPAKPIVVEKVACEPNMLKLFLDKENAGCPKLTIRSLDGQPFSITAMGSPAGYITARFDPDVKATEFVLEPKVHPEKLKNLTGRLTIYLNHPDGNYVYVKFDVLPEYTVNPPQLIVFKAEPEKPVVRKISVINNYGKDFEIESIVSNSKVVGIKVLKQTKLSNGYHVDLEMTPPAANGKTKFVDELSINIKGGEKLEIRCNGYYQK